MRFSQSEIVLLLNASKYRGKNKEHKTKNVLKNVLRILTQGTLFRKLAGFIHPTEIEHQPLPPNYAGQ